MKYLKSAALLILFSIVFVQANATPNSLNPKEQLEEQVSKMVMDAEVWGNIDQDVVFKISFMINAQGEIIVLSTNNADFDKTAKAVLNYQKVEVDKKYHNKVLILPVRLAKSTS